MPIEDFTLSQRTTAKRLFLWLAVVAIAFMCAMVATAQDAGAGMKAGHTEAIMKKDEFDAIFIGKLIQALVVLGSLGLGSLATFFLGKRKPSVDVDLSSLSKEIEGVEQQHADKIAALESQNRLLFKKIDALTETLTRLSTGQATNTANIDDIKATVHNIHLSQQSLNSHILELSRETRKPR